MQLQAVLTHPIPEYQDAVQLVQEVLDAKLWVCHQKKLKFENGFFPEYCLQICQLLCDDLFTFHTELKKVVISIAKLSYDIFPKGSSLRSEEIKNCIIGAATKLLKTGDYLQISDLSDGKFKNFVSHALKDVCLEFFYSNSKKVLKNTDDFHQTIPVNALNLMTSVDKLVNIPELHRELEEMLQHWAKIVCMTFASCLYGMFLMYSYYYSYTMWLLHNACKLSYLHNLACLSKIVGLCTILQREDLAVGSPLMQIGYEKDHILLTDWHIRKNLPWEFH
ncbi:hypothetical protein F4604DRAFT_1686099 [Suillus subluteus]|nr:hypothetical protein F4604DRAFT_1686099 [Suillus subluteus]